MEFRLPPGGSQDIIVPTDVAHTRNIAGLSTFKIRKYLRKYLPDFDETAIQTVTVHLKACMDSHQPNFSDAPITDHVHSNLKTSMHFMKKAMGKYPFSHEFYDFVHEPFSRLVKFGKFRPEYVPDTQGPFPASPEAEMVDFVPETPEPVTADNGIPEQETVVFGTLGTALLPVVIASSQQQTDFDAEQFLDSVVAAERETMVDFTELLLSSMPAVAVWDIPESETQVGDIPEVGDYFAF